MADTMVAMMDRPPEDKPDEIWIGDVGPIPVHYEDDPRLAEDCAAWSTARAGAQALHSADELLGGIRDADWRVRHETVDRLVARAGDDPQTLPALFTVLQGDPQWQVRDAVAMAIERFGDDERVVIALHRALEDDHDDVRWSARFSLTQIGAPADE